jgi:hypothetical protein
MSTLDDVPHATRFKMMQLFRSESYCFATYKQGRAPTFYFAFGGLTCLNSASLCGRMRTMHGHGALIDITQTEKRHMFFDQDDTRDAAGHRIAGPRVDVSRDLGQAQSQAAVAAIFDANRSVPAEDDYHFEYTVTPAHGRQCSRRHPSGGQVVLDPIVTSDTMAIGIVNRMLARPCQVKLDNHLQFTSVPTQPAQTAATVAQYLASV